ncbi:MAG: hypothetical protein LBG44_04445 [Gemmatimonadota bacterium]|jgi:hypothetical protein|nr:hypothetical protein [Gemmatimonadota bacterium]
MKYRLSHVSIHQAGKISALVYGILGLLIMPLFLIASIFDPEEAFPIWVAILLPLFYAGLGYLCVALCIWVYNVIAARIGGVEFTLSAVPDSEHAD